MISQRVVAEDGTSIHSVFMPGREKDPKAAGTIFWIHGFGEHIGRYERHFQYFADFGYASVGFDLRGHGQSSGPRAYINRFEDYLSDILTIYHHYEPNLTEPVFLIGHSMGGLILIRFLQLHGGDIPYKTAVASSPLLGIRVKVPVWKDVLGNLAAKIYPKLAIPSGLDPTYISHDPDVVQKYAQDPLVLTIATAGWFAEIKKHLVLAHHEARAIPRNFHILMAGDDQLVDPNATREFYKKLDPTIAKSLTTYEGWYHEILNEPERHKVLQQMHLLFQPN